MHKRHVLTLVLALTLAAGMTQAAPVTAVTLDTDNSLTSATLDESGDGAGDRTVLQSQFLGFTVTAIEAHVNTGTFLIDTPGLSGAGTRMKMIDGETRTISGDPASITNTTSGNHEWRVDTGFAGLISMTLQFDQPLLNGPGVDLLYFELDGNNNESLTVQIGQNSLEYAGTLMGKNLFSFTGELYKTSTQADTLLEFENSTYDPFGSGDRTLAGMGIDLSDLGIDPGASVSEMTLTGDGTDPLLIAGIVPEPTTMVLMGLGGLGLIRRRRR